jgi:hypothetical protein
MPIADPIRIVDARELDVSRFDGAKVTRVVRRNLEEHRRALKEAGFVVPPDDDGLPTEEEVAGYVSNVRAWLDNESRHAKEVVVDLSATPASRETLLQWIRGISEKGFNDRDFDLSVTSHSRASSRRQWFDWATANGIDHFAMVIPPATEESISIAGVLSEHVGRIRTTDEWHSIAKEVNRDRKGMSLLFSLGLHHNDPHQMLPIPSGRLAAATKVLIEYRDGFLRRRRRAGRHKEE